MRLVSLAFTFFSMVVSASFTANLSSQLTVRLLTSESFTLRVRQALSSTNACPHAPPGACQPAGNPARDQVQVHPAAETCSVHLSS